MTDTTRLKLVRGLIGLSFAAILLIGGAFVVTGGTAGGVPTVPIIIMAFAMVAERSLRAKIEANTRAR